MAVESFFSAVAILFHIEQQSNNGHDVTIGLHAAFSNILSFKLSRLNRALGAA